MTAENGSETRLIRPLGRVAWRAHPPGLLQIPSVTLALPGVCAAWCCRVVMIARWAGAGVSCLRTGAGGGGDRGRVPRVAGLPAACWCGCRRRWLRFPEDRVRAVTGWLQGKPFYSLARH